MDIEKDIQLDFSDVLIKPRKSSLNSRKDVIVTRNYEFRWFKGVIKGTGIMNSNMGTIGNFDVARAMLKDGLFTCLHKYHSKEDLLNFFKNLDYEEMNRCFLSIGLHDDGVVKLEYIKNNLGRIPAICIDVPNAYIPQVIDLTKSVREMFPECLLMVGNIVTPEIIEEIVDAGADIVKVGIGSGAQCWTRKMTGVGRPQLSAIDDCAFYAGRCGGLVCSDGGITCAGDICKAFGADADFVMVGSLYAGTDEAEGEIITKTIETNERYADYDAIGGNTEYINKYVKKEFKKFYGMSSEYAQKKFCGGVRDYRTSEGRVTLVPYVGSVADVNKEFLGGLRSMMMYIGARSLEDVPYNCKFYRVNHQLNTTYESTTIGK